MKFKCFTCHEVLSKSYDVDPAHGDIISRPWYRDETGLNHLAIACLLCGTIHDASGSFLRGVLSGFTSPLKVHNDLNPMELGTLIMQRTDHPESESRRIAVSEIGIPEEIIDVLLQRNILGSAFSCASERRTYLAPGSNGMESAFSPSGCSSNNRQGQVKATEGPMSQRFVPCRNEFCRNTPLNVEVGQALAFIEYNLRNNPAASFTVLCDHCGIESSYTYSEILGFIEPQRRPRPLPRGQQWAILLYEIETADTMEHRGFLAERVLVEVVECMPDAWTGILLAPMQFAPSVYPGTHVGGPVVSSFLVCEWWVSGQSRMAMPIEGVPKGSVFGIFFGNKGMHFVELQTANLFCSNPSCNFVFSPTHSQVTSMLAEASQKPNSDDTTPNLMLTCNLCGISRVVDESSFDGLFHV